MKGDFPWLAQQVRERLPLGEALSAYGLQINRGGFARCPFHGPERTPSLKVYPRRWHCFGCGRGGDLVDFVQARFGLGPRQAVERIDGDFSLGLAGKGRIRAEAEAFARRREAAKARQEEAARAYDAAYRLWAFWDHLVRLYTPLSPDDVTDAYGRALWALPQAEYELEAARDRYLQTIRNTQGGDCDDVPERRPQAPSQAGGGHPDNGVSPNG